MRRRSFLRTIGALGVFGTAAGTVAKGVGLDADPLDEITNIGTPSSKPHLCALKCCMTCAHFGSAGYPHGWTFAEGDMSILVFGRCKRGDPKPKPPKPRVDPTRLTMIASYGIDVRNPPPPNRHAFEVCDLWEPQENADAFHPDTES